MKEYKIKVTSVNYAVGYEDINFDPYDNAFDDDDTIAAKEAKADQMIADIKNSLPQELELEITCDPEDLEDEIADAISDETGWLNNSFTYDVVSEKDLDETTNYFTVEIEVLIKNGKKYVYLANDGSSGCEYEFKTKDELRQIVADYAADVIDYGYID